jgi:predicted transcriptional regulator YheO
MTSNNQLFGVSQVAKLYNLSNQTIYRHIKSGKLSRDSNGKIALSECLRVYGVIPNKNNNNMSHDDNNSDSQSDNMITLLKQQIDFLQKQLELANEREARMMTLLENKGLFSRLFKK